MNKIIKNIIISTKLSKHDKLAKILKYVFVKICKIDQKKYFILGSYALREHRTINDLDVNLDAKEFIKLQKACEENMGHIEFYNNQIRWFFDLTKEYNKLTKSREKDFSIEAFMKNSKDGFPTRYYSLGNLRKIRGLDIDKFGNQFFSLKTLLKWKKKMNRPKDKSDIEIINKLL